MTIVFGFEFALLDKRQTSGVTMCSGVGSGVGLIDGNLSWTFFRRVLMRVLGHLSDFNQPGIWGDTSGQGCGSNREE